MDDEALGEAEQVDLLRGGRLLLALLAEPHVVVLQALLCGGWGGPGSLLKANRLGRRNAFGEENVASKTEFNMCQLKVLEINTLLAGIP